MLLRSWALAEPVHGGHGWVRVSKSNEIGLMPRTKTSLDDLLEIIAGLVAQAGALVLARHARDAGHRHKADGSIVTDADMACERWLRERLAQVCPDIVIIGEETAAPDERLPAGGRYFLIDPLDGTSAFANGRDDFSINIGLIDDASPVLGVIGAPARATVHAGAVTAAGRSAWRAHFDDRGAILDAGRCSISVRPAPATHRIGLASERHGDPGSLALLDKVGAKERIKLSSALKFTLIAEGAADIYPRFGPTMAWDTAAGSALVAASGGAVLKPDGTAFTYEPGRGLLNGPFIAWGDPTLARRYL